jgi:hypothetical protein
MEPINSNRYISTLGPRDWEPFAIRLSVKGVMDFLVFKFYKEMTEERILANLKALVLMIRMR